MLVSAGFVIAVTSFAIFILDNTAIETLIYILVIISLIYMLYKERLYRVVIATVGIVLALSMIDTMTSFLVSVSLKLFNLKLEAVSNLMTALISLVLIYAIGRIYNKNTSKTVSKIGCVNLIGFTILLFIDTFVVAVIVKQPFIDSYATNKLNLYLLAVVFVIVGIFIQLVAVIILFTQRNVHKEKEQILKVYLDEQKNHYEYLESREKETKKFRHDLRSHMELISNLIRNHEYDEIDNYIERMQLKIDTFGNIITVQNGIVDAIINQYYIKAMQNGIEMEVKGIFPVDCSIETYDLCTIFSNALSNAYEAAIEAEEKYISLECGYTDKNIIVIVRNSIQDHTKESNSKPRKNADYHGFGLENIKDAVSKYNGFMNIEKNEQEFCLKIIFNNIGNEL